VDSSYAVHPDMRSHTGVVMSLRKGATYSASSKQNLNTKSSTEAELVVIDNAIAQALWTRNFYVAHGEYVHITKIYPDNKSTILLAENSRQASSQWTRHLNVCYFFVTDKIKKGEVKVAFCPTHDMLMDSLPSHFMEHYSCECATRYLTCPAVQFQQFTGVCWIHKNL
jgi:hypothetical protein